MFSFILGSSSIILGLYIIINQLIVNDPPIFDADISYHLGCYDPLRPINHSQSLSDKIFEIQQQYQSSIKLGMYNSRALSPNFQPAVASMAINFQKLLDEYYKEKGKNSKNIQHQNALYFAKKQMQQCQNSINMKFDENECTSSWQNYQQLVEQFQNIKDAIKFNLQSKQKLEEQLAAMVISQNYEDNDQIYDKFNDEINQLQKLLAQEQIKFSQLKSKRKVAIQSVAFITQNLDELQRHYDECKRSQHDIVYCQTISKQIKKVGRFQRQSIQELSTKIALKKKIIKRIQSSIQKLKKIGTHSEVMESYDMLNKQKIQLQLLQRKVQLFSTSEQAKCQKCSDQRLNELKHNITELATKRSNYEAQLILYNQMQQIGENKIKQLKRKISDLEHNRQSKLNAIFCIDDDCKLQQKNKINKLSTSINQLKVNVIDKRLQIQKLEDLIYKAQKSIWSYLPIIDQIHRCLRKKQYYEQLKKHAKPFDSSISSKMQDIKKELLRELKTI